jgi:hypothetical protein
MNFIQTMRRLSQQMKNDPFGLDTLDIQFKIIEKLYKKNGMDIKLTCGACPEQYDVFKNGEQIAYYRLRHGYFRVDIPNCGGETIYEASPNGDGGFDKDERFKYMTEAMRVLITKTNKYVL